MYVLQNGHFIFMSVLVGMRQDCEVLIHVDIEKALAGLHVRRLPFFRY